MLFFEMEIVGTHVKEKKKSISCLVVRWERKNRAKIIPGFAVSL